MAGEMMADAPESESVTEMLSNPYPAYTDAGVLDALMVYGVNRLLRDEIKRRLAAKATGYGHPIPIKAPATGPRFSNEQLLVTFLEGGKSINVSIIDG